MAAHLIAGWELTVVQIHAEDGTVLPALDIAFVTKSDPDKPDQLTTWPRFRLRPNHGPRLLQELQERLDRIEAGEFSGRGTVQ